MRNNFSNRRDHFSRRQQRNRSFKYVRRDENNFNRDRRKNFSRNFQKRGKLTHEKLNDELDNYFDRKGGESLKAHLDNELEAYQNRGKMNENLKKENISLPPQNEEKKEENKMEAEEKPKEEPKEETKEEPKEEEAEEKKDDKKKKKRGKK